MKRKLQLKLSDSRWLAYAAAGMATPFVHPGSAEAEIHYSGVINHHFRGKQEFVSANFPLVESKSISLGFVRNVVSTSAFMPYGASDFINVVGGNAGTTFVVAGFKKSCSVSAVHGSASHLDRGDAISQRPFLASAFALIESGDRSSCEGGARGQFLGPTNGYIGFRLNLPAGISYGWARVQIGRWPFNRMDVIDYAYADPGEPIKAGQKSEDVPMRPAEESLGALALGATGLVAWRKRRLFGAPAAFTSARQ